jgi:DNA-binding PadR family transcriptional regulator
MSVRHAVLGLLSTKAMHGYELKRKFDRVTGGFWQLNFGQIYSTLDRLEREGLVERVCETEQADSERKVFRITTHGRSRLDDWIGRPVGRARALRDDLFVRLLFCDRSDPAPVLRMIARHRDAYELEIRKLTKRKARLERLELGDGAIVTDLLMDAALLHAQAELQWLAHVEAKLVDAKLDGSWGRKSQKPKRP